MNNQTPPDTLYRTDLLSAATAGPFTPKWLVTIPTTGAQGRTGTHTFVVTADTVRDALALGCGASRSAEVQRHRRGATPHTSAAGALPVPRT